MHGALPRHGVDPLSVIFLCAVHIGTHSCSDFCMTNKCVLSINMGSDSLEAISSYYKMYSLCSKVKNEGTG